MPRKPAHSEIKSDTDMVSTHIAGIVRNGHGDTDTLAHEILEQRKLRLEKQNKKLDYDLQKQEQQYVDFALIKQQVLRANQTVKSSLFALVMRVSAPLADMDDPLTIEAFLRAELTQTLNSLAYENTGTAPPEE